MLKILVGVVEGKRFSPASGNYKDSTFITVSGVSLIAPCSPGDLPQDGFWAAFNVERSRSGKASLVRSWGWPVVDGKGSLNKENQASLSLRVVKDFTGGYQSASNDGLGE